MNEWIACEDEMPPAGEWVLACNAAYREDTRIILVYDGNVWYEPTGHNDHIHTVTHWAKIPKCKLSAELNR